MRPRAFVVGGLSQSGKLLIKGLIEDGYDVMATTRRGPEERDKGISEANWVFNLDFGTGGGSVRLGNMIESFAPDEIYNLASVMYAPRTWDIPAETYWVNLLPCVQILHVMRKMKGAVFVQAGSAEMYKRSTSAIGVGSQTEPTTPYGISKLAAFLQVKEERKKYGTLACTSIFLNMESADRDDFFFARRAVIECVRVYRDHVAGRTPKQMSFGPLGARRDWGLAREYVKAMRAMATQSRITGIATDRVIGTGSVHTCMEFIEECLSALGISQYWPVILAETSPYTGPQDLDCMYASTFDTKDLGVEMTGFRGVVKELVESELAKGKS